MEHGRDCNYQAASQSQARNVLFQEAPIQEQILEIHIRKGGGGKEGMKQRLSSLFWKWSRSLAKITFSLAL